MLMTMLNAPKINDTSILIIDFNSKCSSQKKGYFRRLLFFVKKDQNDQKAIIVKMVFIAS